MKRDMELVRKILLKIEEDYVSENIRDLKIEGYDLLTVGYHCEMLCDANLLKFYKPIGCDGCSLMTFLVGGITWDGHEFLDKIRNESTWHTIKEMVITKGLPMTLDVLLKVAPIVIDAKIKGLF